MDPSTALNRIQAIPGNKHACTTLQGYLESGTAIAFAGAGVSAGLYPMWTRLVTLLAEEAVDRGLATVQERDYWLRLVEQNPQQAVQWIKRTLSPQIFGALLRQRFGPPQAVGARGYTPLHETLMRLPFQGYVTTNYDTGLSQARLAVYPGARADHLTTWTDHDNLQRWLTGDIFREQQRPVLHMHGVYDRSETIVLAAGEYREVYRDPLFAQTFARLWAQDHLVFVGVGFQDKWMDSVVDGVVSQTAGRVAGEPRHLALVGLKDNEPYVPDMRRRFLDAYNTNVVFYPIETVVQGGSTREDHSALQALLDSLVGSVKGATPLQPAPTATPSPASSPTIQSPAAGTPAPAAAGGSSAPAAGTRIGSVALYIGYGTPAPAAAVGTPASAAAGGTPAPAPVGGSSASAPATVTAQPATTSPAPKRAWTTAALQKELEAVLLAPYELEMTAEDAGFPAARLPTQGAMDERIRLVIKLCQAGGFLKAFLRQVKDRYPARRMPVLEAVLQDPTA